MQKKFLLRFIPIVLLLIILYEIWPLPFWLFSEKIILPISEGVSAAVKLAASPLSVLSHIKNLDEKNKQLADENNSLKAEIAKIGNDTVISQKTLDEQKASGAFNTLSAQIIGRTPQSFSENLIINRGANDALKEGQAVLSSGYLIGKISKVNTDSSEVHLITNHDSLIPAILESSRESGLVQGGLEGLVLSEIPENTDIKIGDRVITSGLGGDLPAGILIGEVYQGSSLVQGLFLSAKINSPIDISSLEVVSIVK